MKILGVKAPKNMVLARAIARQAKYIPEPPRLMCPCCGKAVVFNRLQPIDYEQCYFMNRPFMPNLSSTFEVNAVYYHEGYCPTTNEFAFAIHIVINESGISKWLRNWRFIHYGLCKEIS